MDLEQQGPSSLDDVPAIHGGLIFQESHAEIAEFRVLLRTEQRCLIRFLVEAPEPHRQGLLGGWVHHSIGYNTEKDVSEIFDRDTLRHLISEGHYTPPQSPVAAAAKSDSFLIESLLPRSISSWIRSSTPPRCISRHDQTSAVESGDALTPQNYDQA